jgi:3-methylfumaryl-CoA hydratase
LLVFFVSPLRQPWCFMPMTDTAGFQDWIGRTEGQSDVAALKPAVLLAGALDRAGAAPRAGDALPPLWHWLYFLPEPRASETGADGHPARGGFLPPVPLPRRMWAGGRLEFLRPLRIGDAVRRTSTIRDVRTKSGRSGSLVFVTVAHEIADSAGVALREEQDIVYRDAPPPGEAAAAAPVPAAAPEPIDFERTVVPDPVLLFRYSALTFNGHRIHYDRDYATGVEGYPGLVVHGPLLATLLLDLLARERPDAQVRRFTFKAQRPVFDLHSFSVCGTQTATGFGLHVRDHHGLPCMQAEAETSP